MNGIYLKVVKEQYFLFLFFRNIMNNKVFYQHPNLMRALGMHETVMEVMVNVLGGGGDSKVTDIQKFVAVVLSPSKLGAIPSSLFLRFLPRRFDFRKWSPTAVVFCATSVESADRTSAPCLII